MFLKTSIKNDLSELSNLPKDLMKFCKIKIIYFNSCSNQNSYFYLIFCSAKYNRTFITQENGKRKSKNKKIIRSRQCSANTRNKNISDPDRERENRIYEKLLI